MLLPFKRYCSFHLIVKEIFLTYLEIGNLVKKVRTTTVVPYFWAIANAVTREEFEIHMKSLKEFHIAAAQYLQDIPFRLWVTAFYTGEYYGHKTSNVVESTNKVLKTTRELPILELLNTIWHYVMNHRFQRYIKACSPDTDSIFTPWCYKELLNSKKWAMANDVQASSPTSAIITQTNKKTFIVDLSTSSCSCGNFQSNGIPCGHVFSFIYYLQSCFSAHSHPSDYVPKCFTILAWKETYATNLAPISLTDLTDHQDESISAPSKERKGQGRPKVKRFISGEKRKVRKAQAQLNGEVVALEHGQGSQACTKCGEYGHNRRSCLENTVV